MGLLIFDNYDSFTYNLVHAVERVTSNFEVHRNDALSLEEMNRFEAILLSPGPGLPKDAGLLMPLLERYAESKPIFGVCLGLQAIVEHFDGALTNLDTVRHGVSSPVTILQPEDQLWAGIHSPFEAGRYHSWAIRETDLPSQLELTAHDEEGLVMAARHKQLPIRGVQFHPESVMTEQGDQMIANWIRGSLKEL